MKNLLLASLLMIILGVVALTYQGITYSTMEKAVDIGPLQITLIFPRKSVEGLFC
jgi:hypothetical protein